MTAISEKTLDCGFGKEYSNLDCIQNNLWLGNLSAATDVQLLEEKKIKFILTVNSFPLPKEIAELKHINTKFINILDTPRDDILSHFERTYEFIDFALKNGVILVHCYHGVSRSPTIVMSYLMKKKNITVKAALKYVKSRRKCVWPNPGFLEQLELYEIMHCTLDKSIVQYKMFRLYITAGHVKEETVVPDSCTDVIKPDPSVQTADVNPTVYKCKKCRRVLALDSNVIPHSPTEKYSWSECWNYTTKCELTYFVEPLSWMETVAVSPEGKLFCPNIKCKNKLGSFNWVTGCQCPCGTNFCPGFCLIPSRVDKQMILSMSKLKN